MSVWISDEKLLIFASLISPSKTILFEKKLCLIYYIHICYHRIVITLRNCFQVNSLVFDKLRELLVSLGQKFESTPVHLKCDVLLLMVNV